MNGPNDRDPPWSEGPPPEPERCAACGTERFESDVTTCGGCGFTWVEIDQAARVVTAVVRAMGVSNTIAQRRKAIDAVLGELVEP